MRDECGSFCVDADFLNKKNVSRIFLAVLLVFSVFLAWNNYFIQDDAYISFRYAKNFAEGYGLVWYPGLREYGYTNFLYTVIIAGLMRIGFAAETASAIITVPSYLGSIILVFVFTRSISRHPLVPYVASIAIATHYTISSYASGGLETSMQMFLVLMTYCLILWYCQKTYRIPPLAIALSTSLALLCRLDSALLIYSAYIYFAMHFIKEGNENGKSYFLSRIFWLPVLVTTLVPVLAVSALLLGCYSYYGTALPNTFYVKVSGNDEFWHEGLYYLYSYIGAEAFFPLGLLLLTGAAWIIDRSKRINSYSMPFYLLIACILWVVYIISIGGDFMEFRMMVPLLPLFYIGCFSIIGEVAAVGQQWFWTLLTMVIVCVNITHGIVFQPTDLIDSTAKLNWFINRADTNWRLSGKVLGKLFYTGSPDDVMIATHPAGAIPYFSGLPTIDLFGLNDRWVAEHGDFYRNMAGQRRKAPYHYMVERRVNIIIDWPEYDCTKDLTKITRNYKLLPVLLIPLENNCALIGYYLTTHPKIDALIQNGTIQMISVEDMPKHH